MPNSFLWQRKQLKIQINELKNSKDEGSWSWVNQDATDPEIEISSGNLEEIQDQIQIPVLSVDIHGLARYRLSL
jgi:hypothetical protein